MNLFSLEDKVALITGSSKGIGKAIAERMAQQGAKVVISSRNQDACEEVAAGINAEGGEAIINKRSSMMFKRELSAINVAGGGVPFMRLGGVVPTDANQPSPFVDFERALQNQRPVLITSDLAEAQQSVLVSELITTL